MKNVNITFNSHTHKVIAKIFSLLFLQHKTWCFCVTLCSLKSSISWNIDSNPGKMINLAKPLERLKKLLLISPCGKISRSCVKGGRQALMHVFYQPAFMEIIKLKLLMFKQTYNPHCQKLEAKALTVINLYCNITIIFCSLAHILLNAELILYSTVLQKLLFCHWNVFSFGIWRISEVCL